MMLIRKKTHQSALNNSPCEPIDCESTGECLNNDEYPYYNKSRLKIDKSSMNDDIDNEVGAIIRGILFALPLSILMWWGIISIGYEVIKNSR